MSGWIVFFMLLGIVFLHELGHALMAKAVGFHLRGIYIGIPLEFQIKGRQHSTVFYTWRWREIDFGFSWLLLGGAVNFDEESNAPFWKMTLVTLAGPVSNLILAFVPLLFLGGWASAVTNYKLIADAVLTGIALLLWGKVPVSQLGGPVALGAQMVTIGTTYHNGWILAWCVVNLTLAFSNLIPLPALDGGQILMAAIRRIFGERFQKPVENIVRICLYLLVLILIVFLVKDFISLI